MYRRLIFFSFCILLGFNVNYAQNNNSENRNRVHFEVPDDPYRSVDKSKMKRSPAYKHTNSIERNINSTITTVQVNIDNKGNNIVGDAANETSIAVDPTNPNRIVMGWRQFDDVNSNFRQAGYGYSIDGGKTWTSPGVIDSGKFRSDPVLDFDKEGNFYYNSLRVDYSNGIPNAYCNVYKILDGGVEWDAGVYAHGGDKQWMSIDRSDGIGSGNNYTYWNPFYSSCEDLNFTRSTDNSNTFEDCSSPNTSLLFGTMAVDNDGILYMVGQSTSGNLDRLYLVKSINAYHSNQIPTWDTTTEIDMGGPMLQFSSINPVGLGGQAQVDVDKSNGISPNYVYVLSTVNNTSRVDDEGDIMFARSTNGGLNFENAIRINTDIGNNTQWFGTFGVAPNGRIDVVWLDTRDAPAATPHHSSLYYSYSIDHGNTWSENEQLSDYFDPKVGYPQQKKMGDYYDLVSSNEGVHLAWCGTFNGEQDVYYSFINPNINVSTDYVNNYPTDVIIYPNPSSGKVNISFSVQNTDKVKICTMDVHGKIVDSIFEKNNINGRHQLTWQTENVKSGIYFLCFQFDDARYIKKLLINP